jgi:predicted XRE-type DNA-binding protein
VLTIRKDHDSRHEAARLPLEWKGIRLAVAINQIVQGQHSQAAAARRLHVNQPKASALSNYQLEGFSVERLMNFLTALDRDVDIVIRRKPRSRKAGRVLVTAA